MSSCYNKILLFGEDEDKTSSIWKKSNLSRSYTHIVTRASVTEKAYKLARDGFKRISDDVDACLEEDTVGRKEENCTDDGINTTIKGIKINNRRIRGSSSTRPKNALEKMRKKTKASQVFNNNDQVNNYMPLCQPDFSFPTTSYNPNHINMAPKNSSIQISMTELLLQAEKTPIGFEDSQFFKNI
ncbi:hypothetical protein G4B88_000179 [Cannabis sativa]|uniref:Uncharacterized protein n=1 Tax=Cannabis sativa TaxID=3483 RepID=A0A7J6GN02_CANSA|nr:hypothetical protein G4B88_000179 [Cannabis sativa]